MEKLADTGVTSPAKGELASAQVLLESQSDFGERCEVDVLMETKVPHTDKVCHFFRRRIACTMETLRPMDAPSYNSMLKLTRSRTIF